MKAAIALLSFICFGFAFQACNVQETESKEPIKIVYEAINDFDLKENAVPFYRDSSRMALAINAVKYRDVFSSAVVNFTGESGTYNLKLTSMTETDGESTYKILVNEREVGMFQNPESQVDYDLNVNTIENVEIEKGQEIEVQFNSHSNGKIPEDDGHAFSRGRWTELELTLVR